MTRTPRPPPVRPTLIPLVTTTAVPFSPSLSIATPIPLSISVGVSVPLSTSCSSPISIPLPIPVAVAISSSAVTAHSLSFVYSYSMVFRFRLFDSVVVRKRWDCCGCRRMVGMVKKMIVFFVVVRFSKPLWKFNDSILFYAKAKSKWM